MAVTCHEVRNPLNGTAAYLQFAMAALLPTPRAPLRRPPELSHEPSGESARSAASGAPASVEEVEEAGKMVQGAIACTSVALRVLENLTTLEKLRQGLLQLNEQPEALRAVLAEAETVLKPQLAASSYGEAELRIVVDDELERSLVWCDKKVLLQARARTRASTASATHAHSAIPRGSS
eukprot:1136519-Pleurochrysis_carterae.AAC.1